MANGLSRHLWSAGAALVLASLLTGCEEIVYQKQELFNPPPDTVSGFLGYFNVAEGITTCGNCHKGKQAEWAETKHAQAYKDLDESGHAQDSCYPCHTVTELGNVVAVAAGFNVVEDSAYHDVQCESCHGPGTEHLKNPEAIKPLASLQADTGLTLGCGECHTGTHNPFVDEWRESAHGYGGAYPEESSRDPCRNCHEGRRGLGVTMAGMNPRVAQVPEEGIYLESENNAPTAIQPITCAVCHDPHDATHEGQLRAQIDEPEEGQLCWRCHHRETEPESGTAIRRGPHGAQGAIWLDEEAGWIPPNWPYTDRLLPSHSAANPRGCAACHVTPFTINDASGKFVKNYTGHLFAAIPCIDQTTGEPIPNGTCSDDQRYFGGCAVSGCHGSAEVARTVFGVLENRLNNLTDELWTDTDNDSVMESTDGGVLPKVLAQAIGGANLNVMNLYDTTLTDAERAIWNAQLAATDDRPQWFRFTIAGQNSCDPNSTSSSTKCPGTLRTNTAHRTSGGGAHNPFFLEALLTETIKAIQTTYGLAPNPSLDLTVHATPPSGVRRIK